MVDLTAIVALASVFGSGVIIVAIVMWVEHRKQVMRNRERMAAIEKGLALPDLSKSKDESPASRCRSSLYHGIRLLFIGLGLALALYVTVSIKVAIWGVFVAIIGLGHLVYWFFVERGESGGSETVSR